MAPLATECEITTTEKDSPIMDSCIKGEVVTPGPSLAALPLLPPLLPLGGFLQRFPGRFPCRLERSYYM